jgi:hypothetical protein
MRIMHPSLPAGQFAEVDAEAFETVWAVRDWTEAPDLGDISTMTIEEVLEVVDGDPTRAAVAQAEETAGRSRRTLLKRLATIAQSDPED